MTGFARSMRITGQVQGVAYRRWTEARAQHLGLAGWVRNMPDGSVEAFAQGEKEAVETLINDMWSGPGAAVVRDVQTTPAPVDAMCLGFERRIA